MYSKSKTIKTRRGLSGLLEYMANAQHREHRDKDVEPLKFHNFAGQPTAEAFAAYTGNRIDKINRQIRRGRKISNLATHDILRVPDGANLSTEERDFITGRIMEEYGDDSPAVSAWHVDRITGSADLHIARPNFLEGDELQARRQSANPIAFLRSVADGIHDELNERRRLTRQPHIPTMVETRKRKLKEKNIKSLAEQLAEMDEVTRTNLPDKVHDLGHTVTRHNSEKGTISVLHKGGRKACRYSVDTLFIDVQRIRLEREFSIDPSMRPDLDIEIEGP